MSEPTYSPQTWHDEPTEDTPITSARLGVLETGLQVATARAAASLRYDASQSLSPAQKLQAQTNLGVTSGGGGSGVGDIVVAAPTGTSGDDALLTGAIAAAGSSGRILLQPGTYGFTSHLVIPNGVDIVGCGGGSTSGSARTTLKAFASGAQLEIAGGGSYSGDLTVSGNSTATTPFKRSGGAGGQGRTFHGLIVRDNLPASATNDLALIYQAQNDLWYQCGFENSDRDLAVFDQGYGGAQFVRCEWIGAGRYHHRFDNLVGGGVYAVPTDITFTKGICEGGTGTGTLVKLIHASLITYSDYVWFNPAAMSNAAHVDVGTGASGIQIHNPYFQNGTGGPTGSNSYAISVEGSGDVTITGRAWYLGFDADHTIDGLSAHIYDNSHAFSTSTAQFVGTSGANSLLVQNYVRGIRTTINASGNTLIETNYNSGSTGYLSRRFADGRLGIGPGTGFADDVVVGRRTVGAWGTAVATQQVLATGIGTTAQRPAATGNLSGAIYYNTDTAQLETCDGSNWNGPPASGRHLPAYAPSTCTGNWSPGESLYNMNSATLHGAHASEIKLINGDADWHIFTFADSSMGGFDGSFYHYEWCPPRVMGKAIAEAAGISFCNGIQMACADTGNAVYDNVTKGTATANIQYLGSTATGQTWGFTTLDPCTNIDIFYFDGVGSGTLNWTIDGVAQTGIAIGATNTVKKVTNNTTLANTTHTVTFTSTAANQLTVAWRWYNPNIKQVYVHVLSLGGSTANTGTIVSNWSSTSSAGPYGLGYIMQSLVTASGLTVDTAIVSMHSNDETAGTAAATILTGIQNVLGYYPSANRFLVHLYKAVAATTDLLHDTFAGNMFSQCDTSGIGMLDVDDLMNRRAGAVADSLIGADNTHPKQSLQRFIGRQLARALVTGLLARFENVTLTENPLTSGTYPPRPSAAICPAGNARYVGHDTPPDWLPSDGWDQTP